MAGAVAAFALWIRTQPNRTPMPPRNAVVTATPIDATGWAVQGGWIAGAWQLSSTDPRFGGLSALALDRGMLTALTDSGVIVRFAPPSSGTSALPAYLADLPAGPGPATLKSARDSEALLADGQGGWWVAFEVHHWIWYYTAGFRRGFWAIGLEERGLRANRGIEGLAMLAGGDLAAFPEDGGGYWRIAPATRTIRHIPVRDLGGQVAEALSLPDGRLVVLRRTFALSGMGTVLESVEEEGRSAVARPVATLRSNGITNFEGATAAPLPNGGTRLWMVTDDDFRPSGRTLLVAFDLPPARGGRRN